MGILTIFSIGGFFLSVLLIMIIALLTRRELARIEGSDIRSLTIRIAEKIKLFGIDSPEKLAMLIQEINKMNDVEKENRKEIIKIIGTSVKYVVIIPISFFDGAFTSIRYSMYL